MMVGTELLARRASISKVSSSTLCGSSRISASTVRRAVGARSMISAIFSRTRGVICGQSSEAGDDGVTHVVLVVHHGHPAPFVEGGAGVGDAERDQVSHAQGLVLGAGAAQVGVLVVEAADLPIRRRGCDGLAALLH